MGEISRNDVGIPPEVNTNFDNENRRNVEANLSTFSAVNKSHWSLVFGFAAQPTRIITEGTQQE